MQGDNVEWICGFSNGLGSCDAYVAELWGAFEGLKLVRAHDFIRVKLQIDSWVVAITLSSLKVRTTTGWSLLQHIRQLLDELRGLDLSFIRRS